MRELIIGGDGRVGSALRRLLPEAMHTTRHSPQPAEFHPPWDAFYFNMLNPTALPVADIVYICAGVNGALTCAQQPQLSYRVNVDGTIWIAEYYRKPPPPLVPYNGPFVVWVSSTTVEWQMEGYGMQKRITEMALRGMPHVGIVRAGRVLQPEVDKLCELMIDIGRNRKRGVFLWNEEEKPYQG